MTQIFAIGIGCRKDCSAEAIAALVRRALAIVRERRPSPAEGAPCLFTSQAKAGELGLTEAASMLHLKLIALPQTQLAAAAPRCVTRSARVEAVTGLPSLAEAAALVGAGQNSRLVLARISENGVSCAVAQSEEPMR